jgi:hypothetical protein
MAPRNDGSIRTQQTLERRASGIETQSRSAAIDLLRTFPAIALGKKAQIAVVPSPYFTEPS